MRITLLAKPGKKEAKIVQTGLTNFTVFVKEKAQKGQANQAIVNLLADFLQISPSEVSFVSGQTAKIKILDVPDTTKPKKEFSLQENLL